VRNQLPGTVVHHFFADLCLPGKTAQRFADQVLQMDGVVLHRLMRPDSIRIHAKNGRVCLAYSDAGGIDADIDVELAVLAAAMEPSSGTARLARILGVDRDADGFFKEAHPVTDSVAATREGIFLAGCCQGPADIPSSIARGQAAAGRILQKLIPGGKIPLEPIVAEVNPDVCSGCRTCASLCVFGAIDPDDDGAWMTVQETLCRGCGICVAACPAGAIDLRHYSRKALLAEIDGLLKPEHE
jgi:heterodisulfide reductase subunit A